MTLPPNTAKGLSSPMTDRPINEHGRNKRKGQTTIADFISKRPQKRRTASDSAHKSPKQDTQPTSSSSSSSGVVYSLADMPAFPGADLNISSGGSWNNKIPLKNNVRKLVIKNAKSDSVGSDQSAKKYYDLSINKLKTSVESILDEQPTTYSLEELYRGVENLCRYDKAANLWNMCYNALFQYIKDRRDSLDQQTTKCESEADSEFCPLSEEFLRTLYREWSQWTMKATLIRNIFFYLDRVYLLMSPSRKPIWETCVALFSQNILHDENIGSVLCNGIESILARKRSHELADMSLLSDVFRICASKPEDYDTARTMVTSSASKYCSTHSEDANEIERFLDIMSQRIETEKEIADQLELPNASRAVQAIQWESVNHVNRSILFGKVGTLVAKNKIHLINVLFEGASTVGAEMELAKAWHDHIVSSGLEITKEKKSKQLVPDIINHYKTNYRVLCEGFDKSQMFYHNFRGGIEDFVNTDENSSLIAERLAKYADELMKTGTSKMNLTESQLDEQLDSIINIYGYIHGKDVFNAFYKKDLARRLLLSRSENVEMEQIMISKFKAQTGSAAVQQLETMYNDMNLSKDEISKFNSNYPDQSKISFHVNILTQGVWPTYPDLFMKLPEELSSLVEKFETFYLSERKGRKLRWHHGLGNCIVKARFPCGLKELYLSELQAAIVLLFNDNDELSFKSIEDALAIEGDSAQATLSRALQSLACGKVKVLEKSSEPSGDVTESDTFRVNENLNEKQVRIKVNQVQPKKQQQRQEVRKEVERDRHMEVQAAIVRVMKTRRELEHFQLIEEVIKLTKDRGTLPIPEIKKNIDMLLEKEFLERNDSRYIYI